VIVRCQAARAYLVSWSPEPGYHADEVHRGPAETVSVKFESARREVVLSARCYSGVPQPEIEYEDGTESGD
jgi:hypothetical protein